MHRVPLARRRELKCLKPLACGRTKRSKQQLNAPPAPLALVGMGYGVWGLQVPCTLITCSFLKTMVNIPPTILVEYTDLVEKRMEKGEKFGQLL